MTWLYALGIGVVFGALLQRVGASRYDRILDMLRLRDLTILKFMLLAIGVGAVGIGTLGQFGLANLSIKPLYLWGVALGGLVFGVGFALSGYCPGTSLVACAEGRRDAFATVAGALVGALAYTFAHPVLRPILVEPADLDKLTVGSLTGMGPALAGILGGALFIVIAFVLPRRPGTRPTSRGAQISGGATPSPSSVGSSAK